MTFNFSEDEMAQECLGSTVLLCVRKFQGIYITQYRSSRGEAIKSPYYKHWINAI